MSDDSLIALNAEMVMLVGSMVNEIQSLKDRVSVLEQENEHPEECECAECCCQRREDARDAYD